MSTDSLDISEARKRFNHMDEALRESQRSVIFITRHGSVAFAIIDCEFLDTILETLEILSDSESAKDLLASIEDIKRGRLHNHDDVKRELR